jgi:uncharacterized protein (DUF952 family)
MTTIYKICESTRWAEAERAGEFRGSGIDQADGYIHFSTAGQVAETAAKHFARMPDLVLVAVAAEDLSGALKWEPSRGGALFPHLYGVLPMAAVRWVKPLPLDADGRHMFPPEVAAAALQTGN